MTHIAVVKWDADNRVSKSHRGTQADCQAHVAAVAATYPDAFVASDPGGDARALVVGANNTLTVVAVPVPVDKAKAEKKRKVDALLTQKIAAGRNDGTNVWQIDPDSQRYLAVIKLQLTAGMLDPHGGVWRDAANANVAKNDAQMGALCDDLFTYCKGLLRKASAHKDAIEAKTITADVDAYDITAGWPANPPA